MWFGKHSEKFFLVQYETQNYPPHFLRLNAIVQQFDEFYKAYGIKRGDGMYLPPQKRIKL